MSRPKPCRYRYLEKGRSFCEIAITERKYTTNEVTPQVCRDCQIPQILEDHPCVHLDVGVEIDQFQGRTEVSTFYTACKVTRERLTVLDACNPEHCPYFEARDPDE